jgi:glycosyltransferase involved in cell wall biosynthesis
MFTAGGPAHIVSRRARPFLDQAAVVRADEGGAALTKRVVLLRGVHASRHLRAWEQLGPPYAVSLLVSRRNVYDVGALAVDKVAVHTLGERLPTRVPGAVLRRVVGDRYSRLAHHLAGADIVHSFDLGAWFSWQAARLRPALGFRLVITAWETIPFLDAGRTAKARRYREAVLGATDLYLPATERARDALLLEGAPRERIMLANPAGLDVDRFVLARTPDRSGAPAHTILSVGRLVWEKGHQDVMRAVARLRDAGRDAGRDAIRLLVVGTGPDERRLRSVARELGVDDAVEFTGAVAYDDMPALYARADCLVLASLPLPSWEEQFGWVLAEAMAAHVPILASASGAIAEVVGDSGALFAPGDWPALADALARGPLAQPPGSRRAPAPGRLESFTTAAAAQRLRAAYDSLDG